MAKLSWDGLGQRYFETGVCRGVLYPVEGRLYMQGTAWNGLTAVKESHSGGDENEVYADNKKYIAIMGTEDFTFTIEAYQAPKEFEPCVGVEDFGGMYLGSQRRRKFGFSYTTLIGNDKDGTEHGEKIHLVYGAAAQSSDKDHETINDSPDAMTLSWECTTTPIVVAGFKPTSHLVIDSRKLDPRFYEILKANLYGTSVSAAKLLTPSEVVDIVSNPLELFTIAPIDTSRYDPFFIGSVTYPLGSLVQDDIRIVDRMIYGYVYRYDRRSNPAYLALMLSLEVSNDEFGVQPYDDIPISASFTLKHYKAVTMFDSTIYIADRTQHFEYEDGYGTLRRTVEYSSDTHMSAIDIPLYINISDFVEDDDTVDDRTRLEIEVSYDGTNAPAGVKTITRTFGLSGVEASIGTYVPLPVEEPENG